jgi:hypothetical protein
VFTGRCLANDGSHNCNSSGWNLLFYMFLNGAVNTTVVIIEKLQSSKAFYPTLFSEG